MRPMAEDTLTPHYTSVVFANEAHSIRWSGSGGRKTPTETGHTDGEDHDPKADVCVRGTGWIRLQLAFD